MEAGRSLGFSYASTMRYIIMPQAIKSVLPALGNEFITLLKETSVGGYIGLNELTRGGDIIRGITFDALYPPVHCGADLSRHGALYPVDHGQSWKGGCAAVIIVNHLYKSFGDHEVLHDINEHIKPGEKVVIIGPSGSGKSTFLRCMNLLEEPTKGQIIFDGQDITDPRA